MYTWRIFSCSVEKLSTFMKYKVKNMKLSDINLNLREPLMLY